MLLIATKRPLRIFSFETSEVSRSDFGQLLCGRTGSSHTQGKGIKRIKTSVKTSDQAWAKYIIVVLMQVPGAAPKLLQFSDMGKHCSRLAAKNTMVHVTVRPTMTAEMMENVLGTKILVRRLVYPGITMREVPVLTPSIE